MAAPVHHNNINGPNGNGNNGGNGNTGSIGGQSSAAAGNLLKANSHSVSELAMTKFSHLWTIKQFPLIPVEPVDRLCSPHFSPPNNPKDLWFLKLRLKAVEEVDDQVVSQEYIGVHLFLRESGDKKKEVRAHYTISVLDAQGNKRYTGECSKPEGRVFKSGTEGHGYKLLCPRDNILRSENRLLGDDQSLNIRVEVTVFGEVKSSNPSLEPRYNAYTEDQMAKHAIAQGFASLFEKQKGCDFNLVAKGEIKIPCHRTVLIARSDYFETMLDHPTLEKKNNEVILNDIDADVLRETLRFIYTDEVPQMAKFHYDLLVVADRLILPKLKMMCEDFLLKNLSMTTVGRTLTYADMAQTKKLREAALDFAADHSQELVKDVEWGKVVSKRPLLYKDAFETLAKRRKSQ